MIPMPQAPIKNTSEWRKTFAWLPVRCRNGDYKWMRTVLVREVEITYGALLVPIYQTVKEYDTPSRVMIEILKGQPQ